MELSSFTIVATLQASILVFVALHFMCDKINRGRRQEREGFVHGMQNGEERRKVERDSGATMQKKREQLLAGSRVLTGNTRLRVNATQ